MRKDKRPPAKQPAASALFVHNVLDARKENPIENAIRNLNAAEKLACKPSEHTAIAKSWLEIQNYLQGKMKAYDPSTNAAGGAKAPTMEQLQAIKKEILEGTAVVIPNKEEAIEHHSLI